MEGVLFVGALFAAAVAYRAAKKRRAISYAGAADVPDYGDLPPPPTQDWSPFPSLNDVQTALSSLGFPTPVTGKWDPSTKASITNFQVYVNELYDIGLPQNGEPTPTTRTAISSGLDLKAIDQWTYPGQQPKPKPQPQPEPEPQPKPEEYPPPGYQALPEGPAGWDDCGQDIIQDGNPAPTLALQNGKNYITRQRVDMSPVSVTIEPVNRVTDVSWFENVDQFGRYVQVRFTTASKGWATLTVLEGTPSIMGQGKTFRTHCMKVAVDIS